MKIRQAIKIIKQRNKGRSCYYTKDQKTAASRRLWNWRGIYWIKKKYKLQTVRISVGRGDGQPLNILSDNAIVVIEKVGEHD